MASKNKKEIDNDDLRKRTTGLIQKSLQNGKQSLSKSMALKIEEGILKKSTTDEFNTMTYIILTVKVLENLKRTDVQEKLKNGVIKSEEFASLEKDELYPEKWQEIQDIRAPKNVNKEKRKGTYKCPRCKSWYTNTIVYQSRGGDEPMTEKNNCFICEYSWKF
jgi:DNA-directed RNA polymerase subunit M/transcription elongation factor TFIIS